MALSIDFFTKTAKFQSTKNVFVSRMEKYWKIIKRAGSNKGEQGEKSDKIVKRACSFIRYLRVAKDTLNRLQSTFEKMPKWFP